MFQSLQSQLAFARCEKWKKFESADYVISIKFILGESYTLVFQSNHQTFSLRNQWKSTSYYQIS